MGEPGPGLPKVLVVDDEPGVLRAVARVLRRRFQVETASGGDEGLQKLDSFKPDAVVSDLKMPGMDGLAFLDAVARRLPGCGRILLTAHGEPDASSPAGILWMQKPWDNDALIAALERLVSPTRVP